MHALIVDGAVAKYPYTIGMLRKDNPNTSFPKRPTDELLSSWNMEVVTKVNRPEVGHTKNVIEGIPALIGDQWTQVWSVTDASAEEVAARIEAKSDEVRGDRGRLLAETDWIVIMHTEKGTNIPMEWEIYRQALRDITDHANFPWLKDADWPVKPE